MSLDKYISPYIASQFPRLYREEGPQFIAFVKAYYEWMEQEGGVLYEANRLPEYRDIDTTTDEFLSHFKNKYMVGLPEDVLGDKRRLQKHIKEIYSSKGTAQGLELLFRLLYNESSEIYLPGDDILRPSDGNWIQPVYLEVSVNPYNVLLIGEKITGRESGATAIVEDFQTRYINKRQINVLFLSNLRGNFETNEIILSNVISDPLASPSVIGSMTDILINESGFGFKVGDVLEVGGGAGLLGKAVVSSVSPRNGAVSFTIEHGGSGYANNNIWAPNDIRVEAIDPDNPGIGADFEIGEIVDTEVIVTAVDHIAPYANTQLNSPDYQFPTAVGVENINTPLNQALNVQNITIGTIKSLRAINPGAGYNGPVRVTVDSPVISGLMIRDEKNGDYKGNNAIVDGKASAGNGAINTVKIMNSGIGYANGDIVTLTNPDVPFIAGGAVILQKQGTGEGYWKDTRSFLNSDKYIQDSFYYQEYSYETRLSVAFSYYSDLLKKLWHPAGTQGFGKVVVSTLVDSESEAVEVDIVATRISEYMTQFGTFIVTTRQTSTAFGTQYATSYLTQRPTLTSRQTFADYLVNQPNLVINGTFAFDVGSWVVRGGTVTWNAGKARIARSAGGGSIRQVIPVANGTAYQLEFGYSGANGTGTSVYATLSDTTTGANVLTSGTYTGAANTGVLRFTANADTINVILVTNGVDGQIAEFDDIVLRAVPTLSRQTEFVTTFSRDTAIDGGTRSTVFNTTTAFVTNYNTSYTTTFDSFASKITAFATQLYTASTYSANRVTDRGTATTYNTLFNTNRLTSTVTSTAYNTAYATNRATLTEFTTTFNTTYATNRATTTTFNTTYDTLFNTSYGTTTTYLTTVGAVVSTNRATTTTFDTSKATDTTIQTSRATGTSVGTNRATWTVYQSAVQTARVTDTGRTTVFGTTFNTQWQSTGVVGFNTTYITYYYVEYMTYTNNGQFGQMTGYTAQQQTTRGTSRNSTATLNRQTARDTSRATYYGTTTTFGTLYDAGRATNTAFVSFYNTTTTFATSYATTTIYATNRATTTNYNTDGTSSASTSRATDTTIATNRSTTASTSKVTTTVFEKTIATNRLTTMSTATIFDTTRATLVNTTTIYFTNFDTALLTTRATTTSYTTLFMTSALRLTDVITNRSTLSSVATPVGRITSRATSATTNRATATSRVTTLATVVATSVQRDTNRPTVFVAYPTSFLTNYNTLTQVATDYQTVKQTTKNTGTVYDTEYPTERQTSVLTQTDVAD